MFKVIQFQNKLCFRRNHSFARDGTIVTDNRRKDECAENKTSGKCKFGISPASKYQK